MFLETERCRYPVQTDSTLTEEQLPSLTYRLKFSTAVLWYTQTMACDVLFIHPATHPPTPPTSLSTPPPSTPTNQAKEKASVLQTSGCCYVARLCVFSHFESPLLLCACGCMLLGCCCCCSFCVFFSCPLCHLSVCWLTKCEHVMHREADIPVQEFVRAVWIHTLLYLIVTYCIIVTVYTLLYLIVTYCIIVTVYTLLYLIVTYCIIVTVYTLLYLIVTYCIIVTVYTLLYLIVTYCIIVTVYTLLYLIVTYCIIVTVYTLLYLIVTYCIIVTVYTLLYLIVTYCIIVTVYTLLYLSLIV